MVRVWMCARFVHTFKLHTYYCCGTTLLYTLHRFVHFPQMLNVFQHCFSIPKHCAFIVLVFPQWIGTFDHQRGGWGLVRTTTTIHGHASWFPWCQRYKIRGTNTSTRCMMAPDATLNTFTRCVDAQSNFIHNFSHVSSWQRTTTSRFRIQVVKR